MPVNHRLTYRPISGPEELDLFRSISYVQNAEIAADLAAGLRHPQWMWVAVDEQYQLLARVAWWSRPHRDAPDLMDIFDFADGAADVGVELLRTALAAVLPDGATRPEYIRFVPPDWHDDPTPVTQRMAVLENLGARLLVERLRFEWRGGAVPRPDRLRFRSFSGAEEAVELMTRALAGTLDAHSLAEMARMPAGEVARKHFEDELARYPTPREWWRVATLPGGEPVGFVFPARNAYNPIIAYIGVLPEHRGHGYIDDVLAEGTRILAAEDVPRIRATTDVGNAPMARAFARAGFENYQGEINMTWS
ncbi:GNAT family N-acetyltransferase [Micromonospora sp. NPDC023737]|uniref:GNAT family N-acetyltransferase n=1 Tax=unclassified Micromonospora TaxID=2617518 RepID=UPI0033FD44C5